MKWMFILQQQDAFSEDDELWIPTYEDLLAVDPAEIIAADYETYQEVGELACPWTNGKKLLPFSEKVRYNMRLAAPSPLFQGAHAACLREQK